jgi:hypothetical protein
VEGGVCNVLSILDSQMGHLNVRICRYLNEALNNVSIESATLEKRLKYAKLFAPDLEKELAFLK